MFSESSRLHKWTSDDKSRTAVPKHAEEGQQQIRVVVRRRGRLVGFVAFLDNQYHFSSPIIMTTRKIYSFIIDCQKWNDSQKLSHLARKYLKHKKLL